MVHGCARVKPDAMRLRAPSQIFDFGDQLGPYPVNTAEDERRSEAAVTRRRHRERHLVGREGLQPAPQSRQLGLFDAGAGAAGIYKASVGIIVGEQAPR